MHPVHVLFLFIIQLIYLRASLTPGVVLRTEGQQREGRNKLYPGACKLGTFLFPI